MKSRGRFRCPGQWTTIDPTLVDFDPNTGELTLPWNVLGPALQRGAGDVHGGSGGDRRRREVGAARRLYATRRRRRR